MAKELTITMAGIVLEQLPRGFFKVRTDGGLTIKCHPSGRIRQNHIAITVADRVTIETSCYDFTVGRIAYRL